MAQNKTIFSQWNRQAMQINNVMVMECLAISCVSAVFNYLQCRELNSVPAVQLLFKQIAKWWYWKTPLVPNCMQFKKKKKKTWRLIEWMNSFFERQNTLHFYSHWRHCHISCESTFPVCPMLCSANWMLLQQLYVPCYKRIFNWYSTVLSCAGNNWCNDMQVYTPVTRFKCLMCFLLFFSLFCDFLVHVVTVAVKATAGCMCLCTCSWSH